MLCKNCGKEIDLSNNKQVQPRQFHCSKKCAVEWNKKTYVYKLKIQKEKICPVCNKSFTPRSSLTKYCSYACSNTIKCNKNNKFSRDKIKCKYCNKEFTPYTRDTKYCSYTCRLEDIKSSRTHRWSKEQCDKRKGKSNPCYRNGLYSGESRNKVVQEKILIKNSKELKQKMIDECGYIYCQNCNTSNSPRFETHHIIFRSEKPLHEHLHSKSNLIILCIKCHNDFHAHKSKRVSLVEDRNLMDIFK